MSTIFPKTSRCFIIVIVATDGVPVFRLSQFDRLKSNRDIVTTAVEKCAYKSTEFRHYSDSRWLVVECVNGRTINNHRHWQYYNGFNSVRLK